MHAEWAMMPAGASLHVARWLRYSYQYRYASWCGRFGPRDSFVKEHSNSSTCLPTSRWGRGPAAIDEMERSASHLVSSLRKSWGLTRISEAKGRKRLEESQSASTRAGMGWNQPVEKQAVVQRWSWEVPVSRDQPPCCAVVAGHLGFGFVVALDSLVTTRLSLGESCCTDHWRHLSNMRTE